MNNKKIYFEAKKTPSGFQVFGSPEWTAQYQVRNDISNEVSTDPDIFSDWKWDGTNLRIRTCFSGVIPLYYYEDSTRFVVSPSLALVVSRGIPTTLDDDALAVFLRIGYFLRDSTPLKHVHTIGPNVDFIWPTQPKPDFKYPIHYSSDWSLQAAKQAYLELFHESISKRLPPEYSFAMPLSGGRDSRHILLELLKFGFKPAESYTADVFLPRQTSDIGMARDLADRIGIPHKIVNTYKWRALAEEQNNLITDFCADEHSWSLGIPDFLGCRYKTIYDGINGGILFGRIGAPRQIKFAEEGKFDELSADLLACSKVPSNWFSLILKNEIKDSLSMERAQQVLSEELKSFAFAPNPLQAFYFWNRLRRETSLFTFGILGKYNVLCPFMDQQLVDFALSLTPEISTYSNFQSEAIHAGFPEFAAIPFEVNSPRAKDVSIAYARRYAIDLLRFVLISPSSDMVNIRPLIIQFVRTLLNGRLYSLDWTAPEATLYLLQFERFLAKKPEMKP